MIKHSQYFTAEIYSSALVSVIDINEVNYILDLGIGDGALSFASLSRWPHANITAFDIDENICEKYTNNKQIRVTKEDVLSDNFVDNTLKKYDLAICNPPFSKIKKREYFDHLFEKANLLECKQIKQLTTDLLFLTLNLILIKKDGCCAIILPDGPITRVDYKPFREDLLKNYRVSKVIELPEKSFRRTEAKTHILIIHNQIPIDSYTELSLMGKDGIIKDSISLHQNKLVCRLDYTYNKWKLDTNTISSRANLSISIKRGSFMYKELRKTNYKYLHSNSYTDGECLRFDNFDYSHLNNKVIAVAGDIVMCRVGKRCVGKIGYIESGQVVLSDCLYKITVPKTNSKRLFKLLCSKKFKRWIQISSHGVCSKVISKSELLDYIKNEL